MVGRRILKWIGVGVLAVMATGGGYVTYHFYAPIGGIELSGHYVNRAQIIEMVLRDYVEGHLKKAN